MKRLDCSHWPSLFRLMRKRGFPYTPHTYAEARPYFDSLKIFGVERNGEVSAYLIFGLPEDGVCFFDVVCREDATGKWATPGLLKAVCAEAFDAMQLRCLWVQAHNKKALTAALEAGFIPATPLDTAAPVLVMTPTTKPKWAKRGSALATPTHP